MANHLPYSSPLSSSRQLHLRLFKVQTPEPPQTSCTPGGTQSSSTSLSCSLKTSPSDTNCSSVHAPDLVDMFTEDPLSINAQYAHPKQQSPKLETKSPLTPASLSSVEVSSEKCKVHQMDILSFLDRGSKNTLTTHSPDCEEVTEHTPTVQSTDSSLYTNSVSSRTLFPATETMWLSPESLEYSSPLKPSASTTERYKCSTYSQHISI